MNKLIVDAEALKESVRKKFQALPDRCEINELVNAAPAIDAIPLDWLREKMCSAYEPDSKAAWRVLKMWKGEHDVPD